MTKSEEIIQAYSLNTWLIGRLMEELSHADSLLTPNFPTNCVNWVLGHILVSRNKSMRMGYGNNMWEDALINRYISGSDPIKTNENSIRQFEELVIDLSNSQELLEKYLIKLSDDDLDQIYEGEEDQKTRYQIIRGLHWHETYHIGQLELLGSFIRSLSE